MSAFVVLIHFFSFVSCLFVLNDNYAKTRIKKIVFVEKYQSKFKNKITIMNNTIDLTIQSYNSHNFSNANFMKWFTLLPLTLQLFKLRQSSCIYVLLISGSGKTIKYIYMRIRFFFLFYVFAIVTTNNGKCWLFSRYHFLSLKFYIFIFLNPYDVKLLLYI